MRRARIIIGAVGFLAAALVAPSALGGTQDIASDLRDGQLDGSYTQQELTSYLQSAVVQGYGNPVETPLPGASVPPGGVAGPETPGVAAPTVTPPVAGVAGVATPPSSANAPAPGAGVAGVQTPAASGQPLAETGVLGGTLPFTGADLALLTGGGALLLLLGLGARRLGRNSI